MPSDRQHEKAIGEDDRPNTNIFYEKVLARDPSLKAEWVHEEGKDDNGNDQWTTTLTVRLPSGTAETYTGVRPKKGHSKDAAARDYLITNGFAVAKPM